MVWFRVDDGLPTSRKVLQIPRKRRSAAVGVWTLAGAWVARELTDGFVPTYALDEIPDGNKHAIDLVAVGLWDETDGGWLFHDWFDYQPTKADVETNREGHAARQKAYRDRKKAERDAARDASRVTDVAPSRDVSRDGPVTPARPDPTQTVVPTELLGDGRAKRGTRLPPTWQPSPDLVAKATTEFPSVNIPMETDAFCDWAHAKAGKDAVKVDWNLAWQSWMRRTHKANLEKTQGRVINGQRLFGGKPGEGRSYY